MGLATWHLVRLRDLLDNVLDLMLWFGDNKYVLYFMPILYRMTAVVDMWFGVARFCDSSDVSAHKLEVDVLLSDNKHVNDSGKTTYGMWFDDARLVLAAI